MPSLGWGRPAHRDASRGESDGCLCQGARLAAGARADFKRNHALHAPARALFSAGVWPHAHGTLSARECVDVSHVRAMCAQENAAARADYRLDRHLDVSTKEWRVSSAG